MNREEMLRMVESLHKDWEIDKERVFAALEESFGQAIRKQYALKSIPRVCIDRVSGEISAFENDSQLDLSSLGRVAYQFAKQSFLQKLKEGKNRTVSEEYQSRIGTLVATKVLRTEGDAVLCELGRHLEAVLPRAHQIPGESYPIGRRLRAVLAAVETRGSQTDVVLSRTDDRLVGRLFEIEVPELQNGTCVLRGTAREPGYRSKILVATTKDRVDPKGACIGVRGSRIKNVIDELNGENVDVIAWSDDPETLLRNAMSPAQVLDVKVDPDRRRATIYVDRSELSQAIGKGGRNVRLASRLTGWEIDIFERKEEAPAAVGQPADADRGAPPETNEGQRTS